MEGETSTIIELISQIIVMLIGVVGVYINLKVKTEKNTQMINSLTTSTAERFQDTNEKIQEIERDHKDNFKRVWSKMNDFDKDLKRISSDTGEIKGYLKRMSEVRES